MIYFISQKRLGVQNAAGKAPVDIYTLCARRGWTELFYPNVENWKYTVIHRARRSALVTSFWLGMLTRLKAGDIVFYQHPASYGSKIAYRFVKLLQQRGVRFIMLIHDLNTLRFGLLFSDAKKTNVHFEDGPFLQLFDVIICHNEHMKAHLLSQGIQEKRLICLELFDYLLPSGIIPAAAASENLVIAGNLLPKKSGYIYELAKTACALPVHVYGANYDDTLNPK